MRRMLLAALFASTAAHAQNALPATAATPEDTIRLPDMVVTATRIPTLIEKIPAGVTVIDRATITARGYTTLAEALDSVPGLHMAQSGGPGGNASVFIRGTNSNHVLVLRDGMPVNDPSDPGGQYNFGADTLGDVDRIEIVRGPMSSLYGSGAIGGVINIITRKGAAGPHGTAEIAYGLPRAVLASAGLSGATGRFDYNLNVEIRNDRGFDSTPKRESIYTGAPNGFSSRLASIDLGFTPIPGTRISAFLRGRSSAFNLDELGSPSYDANSYTGKDNALFGRLAVTSTLFHGALDTSLALGRAQTDRHYVEPLEPADPNQASGDTRYHGRRTDLQWNNTLHLPDFGPASAQALLFGYEHIQDSSHSSVNTSSGGFPYQSDVRASAVSDASHVGAQTTLFDRLTLTGDLREESARYGGQAFTWRAGGVLALPEILSHLKASYGTAFRAPSLFDLFGADSYGYVGNPHLRPERSTGYELGWSIDLPAFGHKDAATIGVTYFNNRIHDLITTVYAPDFSSATTQNIARARTQGIETSLTVRPAPWLEADLSYTLTDARNGADNSRLLRRPHDQVNANLRLTPLPGLVIAPEVIYTGAFQDYLVDNNGFSTGIGRNKGGTLLNLSVSYAITRRFMLFVDARNIGGSHYEPASGFQTPGTSALAGIRAHF
ncbi:MAG: TonB-dependent receptor [Rhodospirillales bacterium]|nr:TonB-dependent receptor [Rhodospirillales bacterium]MDE2199873.1 TonB-dependent receptor [Rhodospirillales bacterium]